MSFSGGIRTDPLPLKTYLERGEKQSWKKTTPFFSHCLFMFLTLFASVARDREPLFLVNDFCQKKKEKMLWPHKKQGLMIFEAKA